MRTSSVLLAALCLYGCGSGGGVPVVRSGEQYNQMLREAESVSKEPLVRAERGEPISEADKTALRKARDLFTGMRDYDPELPQPHFALAKIARAMQDEQSALDHYNDVIQLLSARKTRTGSETTLLAEAYGEVSRMMVLRNQLDDAGKAADTAHQLAPEDPRFQVDQASVLIQQKREKEAIELLDRVLLNFPGEERARSLRRLLGD